MQRARCGRAYLILFGLGFWGLFCIFGRGEDTDEDAGPGRGASMTLAAFVSAGAI